MELVRNEESRKTIHRRDGCPKVAASHSSYFAPWTPGNYLTEETLPAHTARHDIHLCTYCLTGLCGCRKCRKEQA